MLIDAAGDGRFHRVWRDDETFGADRLPLMDDGVDADDQPVVLPAEAAEHTVTGDRSAVSLEHRRAGLIRAERQHWMGVDPASRWNEHFACVG